MHMALGIGLLTVGGLEVTWGFSQYEERVGEPVPTWVVVVHWMCVPCFLAPWLSA